ncbi:hypothetical protein KC219_28320, partial [Mycobacterium tuberculosis]|nr:hypothetical protein [Mycobacterium tuberculosis]
RKRMPVLIAQTAPLLTDILRSGPAMVQRRREIAQLTVLKLSASAPAAAHPHPIFFRPALKRLPLCT